MRAGGPVTLLHGRSAQSLTGGGWLVVDGWAVSGRCCSEGELLVLAAEECSRECSGGLHSSWRGCMACRLGAPQPSPGPGTTWGAVHGRRVMGMVAGAEGASLGLLQPLQGLISQRMHQPCHHRVGGTACGAAPLAQGEAQGEALHAACAQSSKGTARGMRPDYNMAAGGEAPFMLHATAPACPGFMQSAV